MQGGVSVSFVPSSPTPGTLSLSEKTFLYAENTAKREILHLAGDTRQYTRAHIAVLKSTTPRDFIATAREHRHPIYTLPAAVINFHAPPVIPCVFLTGTFDSSSILLRLLLPRLHMIRVEEITQGKLYFYRT